PGFEGVPLLTVLKFFVESLINGILFQSAASMTYRIFVAIIPLLLAIFSAISFLDESIRLQLMDFIQTLVPEYTWPAISEVISGVIMTQNGMLFYFSFGTGLYLSVLMMNSVLTSLNITYFKIKQRGILHQLWVSVVMIICLLIMIILSISVFVGTSYAIDWINNKVSVSPEIYNYGISVFKWIFLFIIAYIFISALFYFAPVEKKYYRFFSAGSTLSTLILVVLVYVLKFYFTYFHTYNLIYGSLGALFAILLCINWMCVVLLIGFDLNVSIHVARHKIQFQNEDLILQHSVEIEE
ncbi:MAG: YihY/virulence factor BrkB family protein, partial [Bacteroidales bacterium]|nr:YihY/virulence factor BrkB family protein [Bacteroidales bacterium]